MHDDSARPLKDLNFKVDESFHHHFKALALKNRLTMKKLLFRMYIVFKERERELRKNEKDAA